EVEVEHKWLSSRVYSEGWSRGALDNERERSLLESEWNLRLVILGNPFVASLLSRLPDHTSACTWLIDELKDVRGPGTWHTTRDSKVEEFRARVDSWPLLDDSEPLLRAFWAKGQSR